MTTIISFMLNLLFFVVDSRVMEEVMHNR
jgi:hypothetical protein